METGSGSLRDLVGYLTGLDVGFEVLDPPELRALLRELADRYAAAAAIDRSEIELIAPARAERSISDGSPGTLQLQPDREG